MNARQLDLKGRLTETKIRAVSSFSDFIGLKDKWNELLERSNHDIFSTWEWLSIWWRHFGNGKRLIILLAEENGELIGIAPLMYSVQTMFGLRRGIIEFIGPESPIDPPVTYSNFIISREHDKCLLKFFEYLNTLTEKWSSIELYNISGDPKSLIGLTKITNSAKPGNICLFTKLPNSNDAFLNALKRKDRKEFRRNLRRLQKDGSKLELVNYSEENQITKGMNILFFIHQKRWTARGFPGKFSDPNFRSFCLNIAESFSKKGWLGLYSLELSGKPVASLFGFKYKSKYYAYDTGMDPAYGSYGVGSLLFLNVMNRCIVDGMNEFDFMWGTDEYKKQWNPSSRLLYNASFSREGTLSGFKYLLSERYWSQGVRLRYFYNKLLKSDRHGCN